MSVVEAEIFIDAPMDEVFARAMDPAGTLEWVTIARAVKDVRGEPTRAGFEMKQQLALRGVPFWVRWELVEVDAPRYARFEGRGPMGSRAWIEDRLVPEDGGTRFLYRNQFRAPLGPLGQAAERLIAHGMPQREANASLQNLKRLVEAAVRA
jgi:uncharacterized protein YndB with AHSA1/START domain